MDDILFGRDLDGSGTERERRGAVIESSERGTSRDLMSCPFFFKGDADSQLIIVIQIETNQRIQKQPLSISWSGFMPWKCSTLVQQAGLQRPA